jgi:alpha-L-fucosidase 2
MQAKRQLLALLALCAFGSANGFAQQKTPLKYWFDRPTTMRGQAVWLASSPDRKPTERQLVRAGDLVNNPDPEWESQSLPIGNGNIGGNVLGSVEAERITFNEKTLWRGGPNTARGASYYWDVNKQSAHVVGEIRDAFTKGDWAKAEQLTRKNFNSVVPYEADAEDPFRFGSFTTAGEFYIETGLSSVGMTGYRRELSLDSALAKVSFCKDGVQYEREYFVSHPANVMAVRFAASQRGKQNLVFSYAPNPVSTGEMKADGADALCWLARLDNNAMQYAVRIKAVAKGGEVSNAGGKLTVKDADEVVFLITADTDYKPNYDPDFNDPKAYVGVDPAKTTADWLAKAAAKDYAYLLNEHYADYSELFNRVRLNINNATVETADLPVNRRLEAYRQGKPDYYLEQLYYQFGRYLLISSSRADNMPANLQGLWHNNVDGPWRIDYHNNINLQMNYWLACPTGLPECELPLFNFMRTLVKPGRVTAKSYFGTRGWTTSVSGNIFGFTSPLSSEDMSWNFSPFAGPWLATHLWNYYDFTRFHDHEKLAHYANAATDIEFHMPFGFKEVEGVHSRTNFDLSQHEKFSGRSIKYFDPQTKESYTPYVIETSIGVDRMFLSVMCHSYKEEKLENGETRVVLMLPPALAPTKLAVLPLVKKDGLPEKAREIVNNLKFHFNTTYDEKDTIGKRYRRQDAVGTPYCVTVDYDTLKDNTVTLRFRDTMEQERVSIDQLLSIIEDKVSITSLLKKLQ